MTPPARFVEVGVGVLALALPVAQSRIALVLMVVGLLALVDVVLRSTATARTVVACSVIGNGFVFAHPATLMSSGLLWTDAVLLLLFLALGGWVETGARYLGELFYACIGISGARIGAGVVVIAGITAATWLDVSPSVWFVFAAMAAGIGVLALVARHSP